VLAKQLPATQNAGAARHQAPVFVVDQDDDGTSIPKSIADANFGADLRLKEVQRMLGSSRPTRTRVMQTPEMSDHDLAAEQKAFLVFAMQRLLALPVGRGMFTLNTVRPIITQAIRIPELNVQGRAGNGAVITLEDTELPADSLTWPRFHNGVAAGLRIAPPSDTKLSTTWITYHRPDDNQLNDGHAGFIMALGLVGHLREISTMTIFDYLSKGHESTSIGLLLGLATAEHGTMNATVAKMLSIHVPALLPTTSAEIDISPKVQTAAVLGVGLLFLETAHRRMTEVLLEEIGRREEPDSDFCGEAYALSAGLALGMVNLGKGSSEPGRGDLYIPDRLRQYMDGSPEAGGVQDVGRRKHKAKPNVGVTSPGATMALGLMFLKTGNRAIAARLEIPRTQFHLDFIRPDCLLLRALCYNLVMWDGIEPTVEWVTAQIPAIVDKMRTANDSDVDTDLFRNAYVNICAGQCFAIGLRYAGTRHAEATRTMFHYAKELRASRSRFGQTGQTILETCVNVIVLSLALINAGSGDLEAMRLIRTLHKRIKDEASLSYGSHMAVHMALGILFLGGGSSTFDTTSNRAIAVLVTALFPQFPITLDDNRYHLQALRHLYVLAAVSADRKPCAKTVSSVKEDGSLLPSPYDGIRTQSYSSVLALCHGLNRGGSVHDIALAFAHHGLLASTGREGCVPRTFVLKLRAQLWRHFDRMKRTDLVDPSGEETTTRQLLQFGEVSSQWALIRAVDGVASNAADLALRLHTALHLRSEICIALARILTA